MRSFFGVVIVIIVIGVLACLALNARSRQMSSTTEPTKASAVSTGAVTCPVTAPTKPEATMQPANAAGGGVCTRDKGAGSASQAKQPATGKAQVPAKGVCPVTGAVAQ